MTRWILGLGWPDRISSVGGVYVETESRANTTDTQSATFEFDGLNVVWNHRSWGSAPDPNSPVPRLSTTLEWDPETHRVKGDNEANKRLKRLYRGPWKHPAER